MDQLFPPPMDQFIIYNNYFIYFMQTIKWKPKKGYSLPEGEYQNSSYLKEKTIFLWD